MRSKCGCAPRIRRKGFCRASAVSRRSHSPRESGARLETAIRAGDVISPFYDSMIAKLITHAATRDEAADAMVAVLRRLEVAGPRVNTVVSLRAPRARRCARAPHGYGPDRTRHRGSHAVADRHAGNSGGRAAPAGAGGRCEAGHGVPATVSSSDRHARLLCRLSSTARRERSARHGPAVVPQRGSRSPATWPPLPSRPTLASMCRAGSMRCGVASRSRWQWPAL